MLRTLLLTSLLLATGHAAQGPLVIQMTTEAEALADLRDDWLDKVLEGDFNALDRTLRIVPGSPAIPIPNKSGAFAYEDWARFLESPLNPTRNACRLLGHPDTMRVDGDTFWFTWKFRIKFAEEALPREAEVRFTRDGREVNWSYRSHGEVRTL